MILSTKGIVLHSFDYSETSIICKVYTLQLGLQSYIVKGVRKKGARLKRNLFAPLSLLSIVANHKEGEGLRALRDATCYFQFNAINSYMPKIAVSLYMSELLTRTLTSSMNDPELFNFIELLIIELDTTQESVAGFPLSFSVRLCQHLGLAPYNNYSNENPYFDLMEGKFVSQIPQHNYFLETTLSCSFSEVLSTIDAGIFAIEMPYKIRVDLLSKLHEYYRLHIPTFGEMKSVQVLSDVFRD